MSLDRLRDNLDTVRSRIDAACRRAGRPPDSVRLVAVTKKRPMVWVEALAELGVLDLGENYPQELWSKWEATKGLPVRWHLIGHLQTNKAKRTFPMVQVIHGVDSLKLLSLLDELAAPASRSPEVYLQVNASGESAKHGWEPEDLLADAERIASCRHIPVQGLMTMAALARNPQETRPTFRRLRELRDEFQARTGCELPELSMGMSQDFEVAIEEGATSVRVGSALFEGLPS